MSHIVLVTLVLESKFRCEGGSNQILSWSRRQQRIYDPTYMVHFMTHRHWLSFWRIQWYIFRQFNLSVTTWNVQSKHYEPEVPNIRWNERCTMRCDCKWFPKGLAFDLLMITYLLNSKQTRVNAVCENTKQVWTVWISVQVTRLHYSTIQKTKQATLQSCLIIRSRELNQNEKNNTPLLNNTGISNKMISL